MFIRFIFDYAKWQGETIFVRHAQSREVIQLLDHSELILSASDLVIADAKGAQALAGVMGADVKVPSVGTVTELETARKEAQ